MTHSNIHQAQLAIMQAVPYLQKTKSNDLKYTFASEADLIHKVRVAMLENGVCVSPIAAVHIATTEIVSSKGTKGCIVQFLFTYRFSHPESSTFIDVQTIGEAQDYGDKACNKAMTIALKYALRQTFLIETGDDPDLVAMFRDADNAEWFSKVVLRINSCKSETDLDAAIEKMRGKDPATNKPLFTPDQLAEIARTAEVRRMDIRGAA